MSHDPKTIPTEMILRLMIEDIDRIYAFVGDMDQDQFINDERTVFAVCYAFVRIGQGVIQLPATVRDAHPEVEWRQARHFRNFMVHVYMAVDPARLFETANSDLPALRARLCQILAQVEGGDPPRAP